MIEEEHRIGLDIQGEEDSSLYYSIVDIPVPIRFEPLLSRETGYAYAYSNPIKLGNKSFVISGVVFRVRFT